MLFRDRTEAGRQLAAKLAAYAARPDAGPTRSEGAGRPHELLEERSVAVSHQAEGPEPRGRFSQAWGRQAEEASKDGHDGIGRLAEQDQRPTLVTYPDLALDCFLEPQPSEDVWTQIVAFSRN